MSWLGSFWTWLADLLEALFNTPTTTPSGSWSIHGNTVTGTITGGLIDTSRPIVDHNSTPLAWTVASNKTSFSTTL